MKHIAIYVRVSSRSQDLRSQIPDLERWVKAFGGGQAVKWYQDKVTGTKMERPGWRNLEADLDAGRVCKVVVWRLDRLGRTARGLTALFDRLIELKIGLVSIRDSLDLSTAAGRLMANVLASVAQYETEVRSERQRAGIDRARAEGKTWGGSEKGRRLKVTDEQVATVDRMNREKSKIAAMARATGLSRPTVYRILDQLSA